MTCCALHALFKPLGQGDSQRSARPNPVTITSSVGHPDLLLHWLNDESVIWQKRGTRLSMWYLPHYIYKTLATMVPLRVQTCSVPWYSNHSYSRAEVKRDLLACQEAIFFGTCTSTAIPSPSNPRQGLKMPSKAFGFGCNMGECDSAGNSFVTRFLPQPS